MSNKYEIGQKVGVKNSAFVISSAPIVEVIENINDPSSDNYDWLLDDNEVFYSYVLETARGKITVSESGIEA